MTLLRAEWMRLVRNRACIVSAVVVLLLLVLSAIHAGLGARHHRVQVELREAQWAERLDALRTDRSMVDVATPAPAVASAVFEFGRTQAPTAVRPALGGLALAVRHFGTVPSDVSVTLESRYVDSRRTETIRNPLLASFGAPDFSVVAALLLPLLIISLTHGLVTDLRELGIWRVVRAQTSQPWRAVGWALALRWLLAVTIVAVPSGIALAMDPGSTLSSGMIWMLAVALCALLWTALAGIVNCLPMGSSACTLVLISVWLMSSFVAPGVLAAYAQTGERGGTRLGTLHTIRSIQQDAEVRERELLEQWYRAHPQHEPTIHVEHTFPVTFVPRYIEQDRRIVPLMRAFEARASERARRISPWLIVAPGASLVLFGDQLAGTSAEQQHTYMGAIARLEQRWRDVLYPAVMSYAGLKQGDIDELALLESHFHSPAASFHTLFSLLVGSLVLLFVLVSCRNRMLGP